MVTGSADDVKSNFVKIESYFKTKLTEAKMNGRVGIVHSFMIAAVNKALDDGFKLPAPRSMTQFVTKPSIKMFDRYLFIDSQPDFTSIDDKKHALVQSIREIENDMNGKTIYVEKDEKRSNDEVKFLSV